MNKILLVDGNSILNRAFYGLPDLTNKDGLHTNAVLGFINIVLKVVEEENASHVCVAFDVKHPTFRHEMYKEYKGTRKPMPDELREQLPLIREVLKSMNILYIESPGYEADDILGTLSRVCDTNDMEVTVLSGDRDLLQLATDRILVRIPKTKAGKTIIENYYDKDVVEEYGVSPLVFIDMKGLMGDTSDNIPGVPGIGEKTAGKLLIEYGNLDGIYENIESMKKSKMKDNLIDYKDQAYMSKELATIKLDCDLEFRLDDALLNDIYNEESYKLFEKLEFKSLLNRFGEATPRKTIEFSVEIIEDFDEYNNLISLACKCRNCGVSFVKDINDEIIGASICLSDTKVYLVKFINFITLDLFISDLKKVSSSSVICCTEIKNFLDYVNFNLDDKLFDSSLAAYLINPLQENYSYDELAKYFYDVILKSKKEILNKREINIWSFEDFEIQKYFAYLSLIPYLTYDIIVAQLKNHGLDKLYYELELPCVFALHDMEKNGIHVDKEKLREFGLKLKVRIDELTEKIYELAGEKFNINSTKQLGEILFEKIGLKSSKKTKSGYSTSVEVLEKLKNDHPIIPNILEYRQLTKLNSTYVEGLVPYIMNDGRIHGKFNQTVTATGRISSTEPNLQNIPTRLPLGREIRKVFMPEEGYVFLDADYSQIELRVMAHLSKDEALINAFNSNADIHSATAAEVFDVSIDNVDDLMRRKAKAVNFGIIYGISSFGLGQDLDISRKEAEGYISKYFEKYSSVKLFLDKTVSDAKENGYTTTMFGRIRPIPELKSSNFMIRSFGERAAMNSPIQGTAADIIKIAMINVNNKLKEGKYKSKLVLQIHDELLIETAIDEYDIVKKILVTEMMNAVALAVPLVVDVNDGDSWYSAK